jgi:hypothetical protein
MFVEHPGFVRHYSRCSGYTTELTTQTKASASKLLVSSQEEKKKKKLNEKEVPSGWKYR